MSNIKSVARSLRTAFRSTGAKVATGVSTLGASALAFAGGGGGSPGAAIAGELGSGQADVMLVVGAVAIILGTLILWAYVKRAR